MTLSTADNPNTTRVRFSDFLWCASVGLFLAILANVFQGIYYRSHEPFYDSMSYYEKMYRVMRETQMHGLVHGVESSIFGANTVCLPFLIASLAARMFEPSRAFAVWFQAAELFVFLWAADATLRVVFRSHLFTRRIIIASFACSAMCFYPNGGLSDFRMDLSMSLLYGTTCLSLLVALKRQSYIDFFACGLFAGACCLVRATAPVFLTIGMLPPLTIWITIAPMAQKRALFLGLMISGLTATVMSLWFYLINFDHLYYYYFVWNTDANKRLPLTESLSHLSLFAKHLGWGVFLLVATWGSLAAMGQRRRNRTNGSGPDMGSESNLARFRFALFWMAVAPLLLLISRGMGLNPFVSMPSAWLFQLWVLEAISRATQGLSSRTMRFALIATLILAVGIAAGRGFKKHAFVNDGLMAAHKLMITAMVDDASLHGLRAIHYGTLQVEDFNSSSLEAVIRFDLPDAVHRGMACSLEGIQLMPSRLFDLPAQANWTSVGSPRSSEESPPVVNQLKDSARIDWLARNAAIDIDYLIVPDRPTAEALAMRIEDDVVVHRKLPAILDRMEVDMGQLWVRMDKRFSGRDGRTYEIWRNQAVRR